LRPGIASSLRLQSPEVVVEGGVDVIDGLLQRMMGTSYRNDETLGAQQMTGGIWCPGAVSGPSTSPQWTSVAATLQRSRFVNLLKGAASRRLGAVRFRDVTSKLWGGHLRSPSYFAASCGGAPLAIETISTTNDAPRSGPKPLVLRQPVIDRYSARGIGLLKSGFGLRQSGQRELRIEWGVHDHGSPNKRRTRS